MPPAVSAFQHLPQQQQQHMQQQQPPQNAPFYPSLHLYPLNDSFVPKQIALGPSNTRVKIGRQTNAKTVPGERNGYFDSKVLSRQHAEIWEEAGKIFIKDVKSSNGTFINGERLSQEGIESEPFELKTDDTVEFGIDIVGEDNKTIIHHKVAAKVVVVLTPEDLANVPLHQQMNNRRAMNSNISAATNQNNALGGMGGQSRPTKSGLTFDHILSRLQTELAKSRETGSELNQLNGTVADIQETLGGALPPSLPPYPAVLPPVRPPPPASEHAAPVAPQPAPAPVDPAALTTLETQLHDTQSTLQQHLDKIRHLESYVNEQEAIKREVTMMKDAMEERKREVEILLLARRSEEDSRRFSRRRDDDDDDDARSVATAVPDRDDDEEGEEERQRRREELGRPRTPEPTGHLADEEYEEERRAAEAAATSKAVTQHAESSLSSLSIPSGQSLMAGPTHSDLSEIFSQNALLAERLEALTAQLDSAMELSKTLQNQALSAQTTISQLEAKVGTLEAYVQEQQEKASSPVEPIITVSPLEDPASRLTDDAAGAEVTESEPEPSVAKSVWDNWRDSFEVQWNSERESWATERERLADAVKEWEKRTTELERKEHERTEKEEAAAALVRSGHSGFDGSSSGASESDGEGEAPTKEGLPMPNGFGSRRPSKAGRRRKHGHSNGHALPNGATLPSPMSSPNSSTSFYASSRAHTRRSTSPSSIEPLSASDPSHPHPLMNGKLPLSPPNTSPRSRAESLVAPTNDDDDSERTAELAQKPQGGALGLANGSTHQIPSASFPSAAQMFAERNGLAGNSPSVAQHLSELPAMYISTIAVVAVSAGVWAALNRDKFPV